jgi:hypothetical protein
MKSSIFWDINPCSPLKFSRHFIRTSCITLQCGRRSGARNHLGSRWQAKKAQPCFSCNQVSRWFLSRVILELWRWRRHIPPKHLLTFNGLHEVISQKIELFKLKYKNRFVVFVVLSRPKLNSVYKSYWLSKQVTINIVGAENGRFNKFI